jgi:hypothetical protein
MLGHLSRFLEEQQGEAWADFSSLHRVADDLEVVLNVGFDSGDVSSWRVICGDARDLWMSDGIDIRIYAQHHPAARQFTDAQAELHFDGAVRDTARLVGKLWHAHRSEVQHWIGFDRYLNANPTLSALLAGGKGKLAAGPRFLLERYADVLSQFQLESRITAERPAMRLRDGQWVPQTAPLRFVQLGSCCIVAERFTTRRLETARRPTRG